MILFSEKIEVPVLKKRREVLPVDITTPNNVCSNSAVGEEVSRSLSQKEEAKSGTSNLEVNNLQLEKTVSLNISGVTLSPHKNLTMNIQPTKEKKCVKLVEVPAISERSGNSPDSHRSVSSLIQGNQHFSPSLLYDCMNCAVSSSIFLVLHPV